MSPILLVVGGVVVLLLLLLFLSGIGGRGSMVPLVLATALGLAFLFFVLTRNGGIQAGDGESGAIEFVEIFEQRPDESVQELQIVRSRRLDVDEDGKDEWAVLYQYDPYRGQEEHDWSDSPAQAIIYDALPCSPPLIHNWVLAVPDNDYLGEGPQIDAAMRNVLPSPDNHATNELVIQGTGPNSHTLSLWRYYDRQTRFPCDPINPLEQGFDLLGFWRADTIVPLATLNESPTESETVTPTLMWEEDPEEGEVVIPTVVTYRRTAFERSQLAIRSVFQPTQSSGPYSFIGANGRTVGPVEQSVDFIYGQPALPLDSPYPEKAVATLLLTLGAQGGGTEEYHQRFFESTPISNTWPQNLGQALGAPLEQLSHVLIQSISYQPDREAELRHEQRTVRTTVVPVLMNGTRLQARTLDWVVQGFPIERPEDCEWRIVSIPGFDVTPGTGRAPVPIPHLALMYE